MRLLILIFTISFFSVSANAQGAYTLLEESLEYYDNKQYETVIQLLTGVDLPQAQLFVARSHFSLGNIDQTERIAQSLSRSNDSEVAIQAMELLYISYISKRNFDDALRIARQLDEIKQNQRSYFSELASFLSYEDRLALLRSIRDPELRSSIVIDYYDRYPANKARILIETLSRSNRNEDFSKEWLNLASLKHDVHLPHSIRPPIGYVYNFGVLLPSFTDDAANKTISRGLYNGILIAVDEFNRSHPTLKIKLHYFDTGSESRNLRQRVREFVNKNNIDLIIGPLYSNELEDLADLMQDLRIPLFAPLANTARISDSNRYIYQINPSFEDRGRETANLAYNLLGLRRAGIITERNSHAEIEARSFALKFEELGGVVKRMIIEDFASRGYYTGDHTPWFANDQSLVDSTLYVIDTLDVVYAPFTGDAANVLLNLTLTGLEAYNPDYVVISNDEMLFIEHSAQRIRSLDLFFSSNSFQNENTASATNFRYDYLNRTGLQPNSFSYLGNDIANFIVSALGTIGNASDFPIFVNALKPFEGLANSIYFGHSSRNSAIRIFEVTSNGVKLADPREPRNLFSEEDMSSESEY